MSSSNLSHTCSRCELTKNITEFNIRPDRGTPVTYCRPCLKEYSKEYRHKNKDVIKLKGSINEQKPNIKATRAKYRKENKEKCTVAVRNWTVKNREKVSKNVRKWQKNNPDYTRHYDALKRARKLEATPKWVNDDDLREIYRNCPKGYEVDHIIPLNGKDVRGLHVPWNLQYLTKHENRTKYNKINWKKETE